MAVDIIQRFRQKDNGSGGALMVTIFLFDTPVVVQRPSAEKRTAGYLQVRPGNAYSYCVNLVEHVEDFAVRWAAAFRPVYIDTKPEPSVPSLSRP